MALWYEKAHDFSSSVDCSYTAVLKHNELTKSLFCSIWILEVFLWISKLSHVIISNGSDFCNPNSHVGLLVTTVQWCQFIISFSSLPWLFIYLRTDDTNSLNSYRWKLKFGKSWVSCLCQLFIGSCRIVMLFSGACKRKGRRVVLSGPIGKSGEMFLWHVNKCINLQMQCKPRNSPRSVNLCNIS